MLAGIIEKKMKNREIRTGEGISEKGLHYNSLTENKIAGYGDTGL